MRTLTLHRVLSWLWLAFAGYLHFSGGGEVLMVGAVLIGAIHGSTASILDYLSPSHTEAWE